MDDFDATRSAVARLRHDTGGSDPWTEAAGTGRCRGGFAWRDAHGNQFDVTISLWRPARRASAAEAIARASDEWHTIMLGNDFACTADPEGWRHAMRCRDDELQKKVGRP